MVHVGDSVPSNKTTHVKKKKISKKRGKKKKQRAVVAKCDDSIYYSERFDQLNQIQTERKTKRKKEKKIHLEKQQVFKAKINKTQIGKIEN